MPGREVWERKGGRNCICKVHSELGQCRLERLENQAETQWLNVTGWVPAFIVPALTQEPLSIFKRPSNLISFFLIPLVIQLGKPRRVHSVIHLFPKYIWSMALSWAPGCDGRWNDVVPGTGSLSWARYLQPPSHKQEVQATTNTPSLSPDTTLGPSLWPPGTVEVPTAPGSQVSGG